MISQQKLNLEKICSNLGSPKSDLAQTKFEVRLDNEQAERDFFKLLVIASILNQSQSRVEKLSTKDANEMYLRAKKLENENL